MNSTDATSNNRLYRDADRAWLGGVCAGLAGYLGFNLRVTRILAFIAFLTAMPIAVAAYIAAVFLIPASSSDPYASNQPRQEQRCWVSRRRHRRRERRAQRERESFAPSEAAEAASMAADLIDSRCRALDERLIRLEKHITSQRYQLQQEFAKL